MEDCPNKRDVLQELLDLLSLEKIEENIFRGKSQDLGFGNIFGGQVLGQALSAVSQTVDPERPVHGLHAYFLRPGDPALPIVYQVDPIRDGKSFTTRRVVAIQKGRAIFSMSASFQLIEEGFEHQAEAPTDIPGPEELTSDVELARKVKDRIPEQIRAKFICDRPIEIRQVNPQNVFKPKKMPPIKHSWIRAIHSVPDDPVIHRYMLAYASDFGLVEASMRPSGSTFLDPAMQVASLDHAMWFHRNFRIDDWLLYTVESTNASGARGLNFGRVYDSEGRLVASTAQEGLIRRR